MLPLFLGYSNPTFQEMVAKLHKTQGQPGGSHPWVIGEVLSPISKQTAAQIHRLSDPTFLGVS